MNNNKTFSYLKSWSTCHSEQQTASSNQLLHNYQDYNMNVLLSSHHSYTRSNFALAAVDSYMNKPCKSIY